jgi:hypothetical protein
VRREGQVAPEGQIGLRGKVGLREMRIIWWSCVRDSLRPLGGFTKEAQRQTVGSCLVYPLGALIAPCAIPPGYNLSYFLERETGNFLPNTKSPSKTT